MPGLPATLEPSLLPLEQRTSIHTQLYAVHSGGCCQTPYHTDNSTALPFRVKSHCVKTCPLSSQLVNTLSLTLVLPHTHTTLLSHKHFYKSRVLETEIEKIFNSHLFSLCRHGLSDTCHCSGLSWQSAFLSSPSSWDQSVVSASGRIIDNSSLGCASVFRHGATENYY